MNPLDIAPIAPTVDAPEPPAPRRKRRSKSSSAVVMGTLRKQAERLDRVGMLVEDAIKTSMGHAVSCASDGNVDSVTALVDAAGKFIKEAGAGVAAMANALDKVSKTAADSPSEPTDRPVDPAALLDQLGGLDKRRRK